MKISRPTPNKLEITFPQTLIKFVAVVFIGVSLVFFYLILKQHTLMCVDKQKGRAKQCRLQTINIFYQIKVIYLGNIKQVKLDEYRTSKGNQKYNIRFLNDESRKFRLDDYGSDSFASTKKTLAQINNYIQNSEKDSFAITSIQPWWLVLFISIFPVIGFYLLLSSGVTKAEFNKVTNRLTIKKNTLFSRNETHYPLAKINKVEIQQSRSSKGSITYRIALILENGEKIVPTEIYDSLLTPKLKVVKAINAFLGLSTQIDDLNNNASRQKKVATIISVISAIFILAIALFTIFS